jgi:hypothetical protein
MVESDSGDRLPLFQRRVYRSEFGVERGADPVDGGKDHDAEADGNQAIFDRGRAGLIVQESRNQPTHSKLLSGAFSRGDSPAETAAGAILGLDYCRRVHECAERLVKTPSNSRRSRPLFVRDYLRGLMAFLLNRTTRRHKSVGFLPRLAEMQNGISELP